MAEKLRIFVSATNDLESERATIGRALAELPIEIGAEIRRTPITGASYDDIFEMIANVDRVYFLMGQDITAPTGAEWHLAWKLERSVFPLRRAGKLTPAAQDFMRLGSFTNWTLFNSQSQLNRLVSLDFIRILNHPANRYGLNVNELELLNHHAAAIRERYVSVDSDPGGAEGGGVLLDVGHTEPAEGVSLEDSA